MHRRSTAVVCKQAVWRYYRRHGRDLPWRRVITPYRVTVSEIMLQQTQVSRVMQKFEPFISRFPDWRALAEASTADIINEWRGLGYNRRAIYLKRIAESVVAHDSSRGQKADGLPRDFRSLCKLPGIGPNTAGSIMAFAFNIPRPFIETNIRSVILHFFFKNKENIPDAKLMPIIAGALADPEIA
ncbi:MAG: A/G-specific adenine glycosylase, partial [Patescibacteria group bacterium]|nr:A/G-specific adenine glycosylase [Patescibacteria group bacterium]